MDAKASEWRAGPNVCRCCLTEGCYKDISTEYFWMGKREVYAEMLADTLNVTIAYSQSGGPNSNSRLICELCISRLRDASDFRRQVLECEKTFTQHLDPSSSNISELEVQVEPVDSDVKLEQVKQEKRLSDDDFDDRCGFDDDDDDDDLDDQPLTKLASKIPKKETVDILDLLDNTKATEKRKSSTKTKSVPAKKSKSVKKEPVKATASKVTAKTEKKKKEPHIMAKENAVIVLQYSTLYPFRLRGKAITCVYCCEGYEDPTHFRRHFDVHHQEFTISTAFHHMSSAKDYLKVDIYNLKCRLCSQSFEKIDDVAQHLKDAHPNVTKKLNLNFDIGLQPYKLENNNYCCYHCGKKMPTLIKLCRHTILHYQRFTCDTCGRNYLTNEALNYHIKCSHSGKHVCRKCWSDFPTLEKKKAHVKLSKQCWTFCCIVCGERFQSWEHKQKHLETAHGYDKVVYKCPECDEKFACRKYFYTHYKLAHTDEGFQCACCGLKFNTQKRLDDHSLGHTGEKQFMCTICSKSFVRSKSLAQHMWIHSESKRFVCLICEKQFAQKVSLKAHMKTTHPDVNVDF